MSEQEQLQVSKAIRNRIVGSGVLQVEDALFNPMNWRVHPFAQQEALTAVLQQVGFVQQVIVNRVTGHLVDGHLRVQVADRLGETEVPCVYVDLDEDEELAILATLDPLAGMAVPDTAKLSELLGELRDRSSSLLDGVRALHPVIPVGGMRIDPEPPTEFREYDQNITTEHVCPRCGYQWSAGQQVTVIHPRAEGDEHASPSP